jgi:F-type H+-transporting ATPase subunit gamma
MGKSRALDKRRRSVRNIRKITRTMELISRARFKKAMDRATAASAYTQRITALVGNLAHSGLEVAHPLLEARSPTRNMAILVLTANRGLCGGYNGSILRLALPRYQAAREEMRMITSEPNVRLMVSGKRGISAFRFRRIQPAETFTHFEDKPTFGEVEILANRFLDEYMAGQLDRLEVVYTRFESLSRQQAVVETLLPLTELSGANPQNSSGGGSDAATMYEFLPSAKSILDEVVPMSFKVKLFKCFLDAAVSEQIGRMVAMKAATENADTMISSLSIAYNRARQGQITSELLEVISGAEALNK